MAKLEIPVVVDISGIESLIDEIKHLQTYKLSSKDEQILVDRDDVVKIFADHVRANIKPQRKKGMWIEHNPHKWGLGIVFECSECGEKIDCEPSNFCPNCGAEMTEGEG